MTLLHLPGPGDLDDVVRRSFIRNLQTRTGSSSPARWVHDVLKEETWSGQRHIMEALSQHRRVAVKSSHGVGKSHTASRVAAWWLDTNPTGTAFLVSTAPTYAQVRAILWRYIKQAHKRGQLRGRVNQTEWLDGDELIGYGRKPSDYDEDGFQGIHAEKVLVLVDEACGVPFNLWVGVDSLLTNEYCRVLAIGNPDSSSAHFATLFTPDSGWHQITISAFDTPNFTGEAVSESLKRKLVSQTWVDDARRSWGEDSALYRSKVLAEFPVDSEELIVPPSRVAELRRGDPDGDEGEDGYEDDTTDVQLGVDVGAGGDRSVIRERRGDRVGRVWRSRHDDSMRLAGEIVRLIRETGARRVCIDVIGIGWGIKGRVEEVCRESPDLRNVDIVGVNVGESAVDKKRFKNLKAEMWWEIARELTVSGGWDLRSLDDQTAADLSAPRWSTDSSGRVLVESKEELRKRIGRSPDDADALLLAFYRRSSRARMQQPANSWSQPVSGGAPSRARA